MTDSILEHEVIGDLPFPSQNNAKSFAVTHPTSKTQPNAQATIQEQGFPLKTVADDVTNTSFNTTTYKIRQKYQLTPQAEIQTVDKQKIIDDQGVVGETNFLSDNISNSNQSTTSTNFVDIGMRLQFRLERVCNVLINYDASGYNASNNLAPAASDSALVQLVSDDYDQDPSQWLYIPGSIIPLASGTGIEAQTAGLSIIQQFNAGVHSLKLQLKSKQGGNAILTFTNLSYIIIGK